MVPATLPSSAHQPNQPHPQQNNTSRRGRNRPPRGSRPNRSFQADASNDGQPSFNPKNRSRKPKAQSNQPLSQDIQTQGAPIRFPITGIVEDDDTDNNPPALSAQDATNSPAVDKSALLTNLPEQSQAQQVHEVENNDFVQTGETRQPRKKNNRSRNSGANGQIPGADINIPRHPPASASNTPMKPSGKDAQTTQTPGLSSAQSSNKKPSPPQGILGTTTTPMKLYAGPTFHASPAPSSLPIPRFFSKSAPQVDKGPDMSAKTLNESSEESSGSGPENSPTMKNSLRVEAGPAREPSPLDFFFNADRQEKAKRTLGEPADPSRAQSSSPLAQPARVRSRHPTGGSIFPMELEGAGVPKTPNERRAESSPQQAVNREQSIDEMARAKTEALKQLLHFPPKQSSPLTQNAVPASPTPQYPSDDLMNYLRQTASASSTPDNLYNHSRPSGHRQGPFQPPPVPSHSPHGVRQPSSSRPLSSQLRNEVPASDYTSGISHNSSFRMPASGASMTYGTPQPVLPVYHSKGPREAAMTIPSWSGYQPHSQSHQPRPSSSHDDALRANLAQHINTSNMTIEDELRKLLKIAPVSASTATS